MRELIYHHEHEGHGVKYEKKIYKCVCGKNQIVEHKNTGLINKFDIYICCDDCESKYCVKTFKDNEWYLYEKD